jgi:transposase
LPDRDKTEALRDEGTLNPRPKAVADTRFQEGEFFDPRDLVQVKYEMLRRVRVDEVAVTQAVTEFGFSRPTFYEAQAGFEEAGIAGLVPKKRGPRGRHKLRADVMEALERLIVADQPLRARELAGKLRDELGIEVHPRTIERAVGARKKMPG